MTCPVALKLLPSHRFESGRSHRLLLGSCLQPLLLAGTALLLAWQTALPSVWSLLALHSTWKLLPCFSLGACTASAWNLLKLASHQNLPNGRCLLPPCCLKCLLLPFCLGAPHGHRNLPESFTQSHICWIISGYSLTNSFGGIATYKAYRHQFNCKSIKCTVNNVFVFVHIPAL